MPQYLPLELHEVMLLFTVFTSHSGAAGLASLHISSRAEMDENGRNSLSLSVCQLQSSTHSLCPASSNLLFQPLSSQPWGQSLYLQSWVHERMNEWMSKERKEWSAQTLLSRKKKYGQRGHTLSQAIEPQHWLGAAEGVAEVSGFSVAGTGGRV